MGGHLSGTCVILTSEPAHGHSLSFLLKYINWLNTCE